MATRQCILLFPDLTNRGQIDRYRERFDPLAQKIAPHVTLVFPFESADLESDALAHDVAERIHGIDAFDLEVPPPAVFDEGYVYLGVTSGASHIRRLHDVLYSGELRSFLRADVDYVPHITIGRYADEKTEFEVRKAAVELSGPFRAHIREVIIERIGADEKSTVVSRLSL